MITLNKIADNIAGLLYPNPLELEGQASNRQIKHWIHYHRVKLIEDNINKGISSFINLYQNFNIEDEFPSTYFGGADMYNDPYGRELASKQDRGDFRNIGTSTLHIPEIIMLDRNKAVKDVTARRRVHDASNNLDAERSTPIPVYYKSRSERHYGHFNKFTKNSELFYTLDRKREEGNSVNNGGLAMSLYGLQVYPNNRGDLNTPGSENIKFKYNFNMNLILQDPTQINTELNTVEIFDDSNTPYPIPAQYVKDLIERVVQMEGATILKTMANE
tara:strand:+ start:2918 stop:3739 length:822 start_codon:yes stop_codon:yes gene_type:complete